MAFLTYTGNGAPNFIPPKLGRIYIDTENNTVYISHGTTSVNDWSILENIDPSTISHTILQDIGSNSHNQIDNHLASLNNPHGVTKTQIGLSNVQNLDQTNPSNIIQDNTHRFVSDTEKNTWNSKENSISVGTTSQYYRGDKSWATLDKNAVGLGNVQNLDQTNPSNISQDSTHRFVSDTEKTTWNSKEDSITAGTLSQYYRGDKSWATLDKSTVGLGNVQNLDQTNPSNITQDSTHRFVSDAEKSTWNNKENSVASGTTSQYYRGDKTWATLDKSAVGLSNVPNVDATLRSNHTGTQTASTISDFSTATDARITAQKGAANGLAPLGSDTKIPAAYLPNFVDDVLEYASFSSFPVTGLTGNIYVAIDTNMIYRWSGTQYIEISSSLALGETSATAYRGDRGKIAYDHSQITSGNPHGTTIVQITGLQTALDSKAPIIHTHEISDVNDLQNTLNTKENTLVAGTSSQYYRGDKTWQILNKSAVGLGNVQNVDQTNPSNIIQDTTHRFVSDTEKTTWNNKENSISAGTTSQYYRGDKTFQTLNTSVVPESGNLYYTDLRAITAAKTNLTNTPPPLQNLTDAAYQGTSNEFARQDHTHGFNTTGVIPGTYGDAVNSPQITVNSQGQVTAVTNIPITSNNNGDINIISTTQYASTSNVTLTNISNLSIPVITDRYYHLDYTILFRSSSAICGIALGLGWTGNGILSSEIGIAMGNLGTSSMYWGPSNGNGTVVTSTSVGAANTTYVATIRGVFWCSSTGTLFPQFRSETGAQVLAMVGSVARIHEFDVG